MTPDPDMIFLHDATPEQQAAASVVIIYHANCPDGWLCAVLAKQVFSIKQGRACLFESRGYDQPFDTETLPLYKDKEVCIFDFSFAPEILALLEDVAKKLILLDHHKTFAETRGLNPIIPSLVVKGKSVIRYAPDMCGAQMVYREYEISLRNFCPVTLVNFTGDRDLWKWEMPGSKEVNEYISTVPRRWNDWKAFIGLFWQDDEVKVFYRIGYILLRATQQQVDRLAAASFKCTFDGHENVRVCNTQSHQSDVGHRILELFPDAPFAVMYYDKDAYMRIYSLRGRVSDSFDCTVVAKKFGGGGHAKACGFKTTHDNDPLSHFGGKDNL